MTKFFFIAFAAFMMVQIGYSDPLASGFSSSDDEMHAEAYSSVNSTEMTYQD